MKLHKSAHQKNKVMKVLRLATTFGIAGAVFLSGCGSSHITNSTNLTSGKAASVIGHPALSGQENRPHLALEIPVTNPGPGKLEANIKIKGEPSEILSSQAARLSGLNLGLGKETVLFTICEITRKRTKPIHIQIKWRNDSQNGVSKFTVPPKQTNIVRR